MDVSEPTTPAGLPDLEKMLALAPQYHIDILGMYPDD
jgi:hypothetical protein